MDGGSADHAGAVICRHCGRLATPPIAAQFARNGSYRATFSGKAPFLPQAAASSGSLDNRHPDAFQHCLRVDFAQAAKVTQRTFALKARTALDSKVVQHRFFRQGGREIRAGRAVQRHHPGADGSGNMHEARIVADGLLAKSEQVDDILELGSPAEVHGVTARGNCLAGRTVPG
jgi:hypothetical protein